ncbi:MAG TPA: alpha/beta hydrolase [Baekduia sp.]|nr:alpha/beta hydrolase [Baekduia sp.]
MPQRNEVADDLDPDLRAVLDELAATAEEPLHRLSVADARASVEGLRALNAPPPEMEEIRELEIPGGAAGVTLEARLYRPPGAVDHGPGLVFFHGGGWMLGSVGFTEAVVRELAAAARMPILSTSYRLAPEHRYPAAIDDARAAFAWLAGAAERLGLDGRRLAVAGESSGGTLAAAVALAGRASADPAPAHQLLLFAPLDTTQDSDSYRKYAKGYMIETGDVDYFWRTYLGERFGDPPPLAAPLRAPDLAGVASATVVVAECDPLRDDGLRYAERLCAAGVATRTVEWARLTHGAIQMTGRVPRVRELLAELGPVLQAALS